MQGGGNQIACANVPKAGIARKCGRHFARFQRVGQVGELVDHDIRPDLVEMVPQGIRVEHVDHDRFDSSLLQFRSFVHGSGGAEHTPSVLQKEGSEAPADGARSAGKEDTHSHHQFPEAAPVAISFLYSALA